VFVQVNPALLGGMTVTVGDRFADMSLVRKIKYYEKVIQTAIV
jgi:F0F1-type ATP synthase delta subunit